MRGCKRWKSGRDGKGMEYMLDKSYEDPFTSYAL